MHYKMKLNIPTEHAEQVTFVQEFKNAFPGIRIFAIPNGGYRHKATAQKIKAEGGEPGVPDLFIPAWNLWIEMKRTKGGRLSPDQKDWIAYLRTAGHYAIVCNGWQAAMEAVKEWQNG